MDKNAIKKYAVWARKELIERVSQRAAIYGITDEDHGDPNAASVEGRLLSEAEKKQREALIRNIKDKGYEQVKEEAAYTWFNRFTALRFMEVNGYLPSHIRVFTNDAGEFKPQILSEALHLELEGLDMNRVYELENSSKTEELFKYLLVVQCNALNSILPGMFQRIDDYTELLLPDYLLREGSVIEKMITTIPEADWTDQVQIIGWLYQYYNTELKDKVFADLKKNIKISKENIPAATQLFTPDWIVHYMVENSLGRLWLEGHPNDELRSEWKYYLDEAEQEESVQAQLAEIRKEYAALKPEEIRVIDPCMGSGHILCVLFDVLVRIYEECGYSAREAVVKIIENNLWGLDIDERAGQLAYFAVMMKARQYDRRFFSRKVQPHVYAIHETNSLCESYEQVMEDLSLPETHRATLNYLLSTFIDAKEYGSILQVETRDYDGLKEALAGSQAIGTVDMTFWYSVVAHEIPHLIEQAIALSQKYHVVVTNPPYMGSSNMNGELSDFVKDYYPDSKSDLFAVFIEKCSEMVLNLGFNAMITQHAWMFLSSFEKLRAHIQTMDTINMIHLGAKAFEEIGGEVVQTTSFVFRHSQILKYRGMYVRLVEPTTQQGKEDMFLTGGNRFVAQNSNFSKIPGRPIVYWASKNIFNAFMQSQLSIRNFSNGEGKNVTTNNEKYILYHWEVNHADIGAFNYKWLPCAMGGDYRKWYGNIVNVIDWSEKARKFYKQNPAGRIIREKFWAMAGITWGKISSTASCFRVLDKKQMYQETAILQSDEGKTAILLALLNSCVSREFLKFLNPTINLQLQDICTIPLMSDVFKNRIIDNLSKDCIAIAKADWDSFETSWDFKEHPFINKKCSTLKAAFEAWRTAAEGRFRQLKENEEELNRIFIDIYGLGDELTPEVEDKDVTVRKADLQRDVRSFISYATGCILGRYSLDVPGLAYAGGEWDPSKYTTFQPVKDGIISICDDEYFEDDIAGRFVKFLETVYSKDTLEENLRFTAEALGGSGNAREVIRGYFINDFYADHLKTYQKRPIYWLFDSGKKNGFKCLVYMHRYQPDTLARIRTDYVHEQQSRYRTEIADLEQRINGASSSERVKLNKQLSKLQNQATEIREYEEKIHHLADQMIDIDLDDGVKHNYEIFKDVLAKIR